ncbi:serine/threonine-protein kinase [Nakamurella endophytica]|uniref:serine/threonine-protein kinase n=1 Tax=Nakamurella endophytica TaxID=1748367 RepID=UPI001E5C2743|nr:serine/threonine-protein kinase [Nakamurella endophytica]
MPADRPVPDADLRGLRLGRYDVVDVLGRGGMSVVYRATDSTLERPVALKVMSDELSRDDEFRARFAEEARAASAIDHVNVVPLYDFGDVDGRLYIAMRLVDGTDLARELAGGPLPGRRALALLGQVGAALDVLHERGLVHLDVKPANVLITRNERLGTEHVYLADFGLTRRGAGGHRTAAGDFLGSPTYASPEHLRGEDIGPAADEYSLACMLFAALAGRPPFVGDVRQVITGQLSGRVPSLAALSGLPSAVDRVIARGMAGVPQARYPSSADLLAAARRALSSWDDEPAADRSAGSRTAVSTAGAAATPISRPAMSPASPASLRPVEAPSSPPPRAPSSAGVAPPLDQAPPGGGPAVSWSPMSRGPGVPGMPGPAVRPPDRGPDPHGAPPGNRQPGSSSRRQPAPAEDRRPARSGDRPVPPGGRKAAGGPGTSPGGWAGGPGPAAGPAPGPAPTRGGPPSWVWWALAAALLAVVVVVLVVVAGR